MSFLRVPMIVVACVFVAAGATAETPTDEATEVGTVSLSRLIPDDVLTRFRASPAKAVASACTDSRARGRLVGFRPYDKIEGLTSSMYDGDSVLAYFNLYKFAGTFSELTTEAYVDRDSELKTLLVTTLANWANAGAYLKTRDCSKGNCPAQWQTERGTELSPEKDSEQAVNHIMDLALAYYPFLADHDRERMASEHEAIDEWMRAFSKRLMFGWANSAQMRSPKNIYDLQPIRSNLLFDLVTGDIARFERRLKSVGKGLSAQINKDGSIRDATVRGNRALWYHFWTLDDVFWFLEVMRANDIDLYTRLDERLQRAVKIFVDGMEDPDTIYKWAKADVRSGADPRTQQFDFNRFQYNDSGQSWLYVYLYRYPDTENAARLRRLLGEAPMRHFQDFKLGANIGCIYRIADPTILTR